MTDITRNYHRNDENSTAASEALGPVKEPLRATVLGFIEGRQDGATVDEIEAALGMRHQTASARVTELLAAGKVYRAGKRKTRSGRRAWVHFVKCELPLWRCA